MTTDRRIILASGSPYRAELLARLVLGFEQCAPNVDETRQPGEDPAGYVGRLAAEKARAVRAADALVIGADQVALLDGHVLGKPGDARRAVAQLQQASGRWVTFLTGLCLLNGSHDPPQNAVIPFRVKFRQLSLESIQRYVETDQPLDCAGSFKAEGLGITLFERMQGDDPTALIGLPLIRLAGFLRRAGIELP